MTIPALPAAPSPTDTPAEFNTKAFAFLAALNPWGDAADALAVTMNADAAASALSETAAETAAGTATTKAGEASDSAIAAAASAVAAGNSATSAAASWDLFDDRYLGAKSSDPSLDNDGNALVTGALYFNSSSNQMRVRTSGGTWAAAYIPAEGYLTTGDIGSTVQAYNASLTGLSGSVVGTSDSQTLTAKTIEAGTFTNGYTEETYTADSSTAITLDLANGSLQIITLTGSPTITMPTPTAGKSFTLLLKTGTGSYAVTWSTVKWPSNTAPTVTIVASKMDKFVFTADGTNWYGSVAGQAYAV